MSLLSDLRTALQAAMGMPPVYVGAAEQGTALPYAVLSRMDTDRERGLPGGTALTATEWELATYSMHVAERETLRGVVRWAVENLGPWKLHGSTVVQSAVVLNDFDDEVPPSDGSDQPRRRAIYNLRIWAAEPL